MPIDNRNLTPGMKLVGRYHKQTYTCLVVRGESGTVRFRLEDGRQFKSISAAGMAITGKSCNGWAFWSIEKPEGAPAEAAKTEAETALATQQVEIPTETQPVLETQAATQPEPGLVMPETAGEQPAPETEPATAKKRIFRLPNQKGVAEGQTRWHCHDCAKSFTVATGETPETCPQGHKA